MQETLEVFKTNVAHIDQARMVTTAIQNIFTNHEVNFDLDDCDRIMRVKSESGIDSGALIILLQTLGLQVEILQDENSMNGLATQLKPLKQLIQ